MNKGWLTSLAQTGLAQFGAVLVSMGYKRPSPVAHAVVYVLLCDLDGRQESDMKLRHKRRTC